MFYGYPFVHKGDQHMLWEMLHAQTCRRDTQIKFMIVHVHRAHLAGTVLQKSGY